MNGSNSWCLFHCASTASHINAMPWGACPSWTASSEHHEAHLRSSSVLAPLARISMLARGGGSLPLQTTDTLHSRLMSCMHYRPTCLRLSRELKRQHAMGTLLKIQNTKQADFCEMYSIGAPTMRTGVAASRAKIIPHLQCTLLGCMQSFITETNRIRWFIGYFI